MHLFFCKFPVHLYFQVLYAMGYVLVCKSLWMKSSAKCNVMLPPQGKLLYCHPPAHINPKDFQPQHALFQERPLDQADGTNTNKRSKVKRIENTVDKQFFHQVWLKRINAPLRKKSNVRFKLKRTDTDINNKTHKCIQCGQQVSAAGHQMAPVTLVK